VDGAAARIADRVCRVERDTVDVTLDAHPTLLTSQKAMVRRLTTSGAGVEVVVGKAGSGKTYALRAARAVWQDAGVRVVGCALSARAARELEQGSGIASTTIARTLADLDHPEHGGLAEGSVLVVDEAAMVGTRDLARLLDHAAAASAKVVLVGDHHQLPAIDAGGAFHALTRRLPTVELADNRRQQLPWERDALDQLRHSDPAAALDAYRRHGRIHVADGHDELRDRLVDDWRNAAADGETDAIMLAHRRADVADLNVRARQRLEQAGELTGPALDIAGRQFRAGDRAVCLRKDRRLGVVNGMRGTITDVDLDETAVWFQPDDYTEPMPLPGAYLESGDLDHGYAITAHKAQGLTCDATFVLADHTIYREWGYVALSRGQRSNHLYLTRDQQLHLDDAAHPATLQAEPGLDDSLARKLARRRQEQLAIDQFDEHDGDRDTRRPTEAARQPTVARHEQRGLERSLGIGL
jgi:ATP-dependent exoDNAse (exonuclease V) alpha subunit